MKQWLTWRQVAGLNALAVVLNLVGMVACLVVGRSALIPALWVVANGTLMWWAWGLHVEEQRQIVAKADSKRFRPPEDDEPTLRSRR